MGKAMQRTMSHCFRNSHWDRIKQGHLTQEDYISRLTAHFGGARHGGPKTAVCPPVHYDHFASAVREASVLRQYRPVRDLKSYEKLFLDCVEDRYDEVVKNLTTLRAKRPNADPVQPLAVLAARHGRSRVLEHCLRSGAVLDCYLANEMESLERRGCCDLVALMLEYDIELGKYPYRKASRHEDCHCPTYWELNELDKVVNW